MWRSVALTLRLGYVGSFFEALRHALAYLYLQQDPTSSAAQLACYNDGRGLLSSADVL
jgi:hypothetical protein